MDSAVKCKSYTATSRICTLNKHLITILVMLILAVVGHGFRNSNAGPLHEAGDAYGESITQFLTLCTCSFLVHGHLETPAWQGGCVEHSPGKPGTCGSRGKPEVLPGEQDAQDSDHPLGSLPVMAE